MGFSPGREVSLSISVQCRRQVAGVSQEGPDTPTPTIAAPDLY